MRGNPTTPSNRAAAPDGRGVLKHGERPRVSRNVGQTTHVT
jgi:hypothetical protein